MRSAMVKFNSAVVSIGGLDWCNSGSAVEDCVGRVSWCSQQE